ncbi:MAG: hypothetical protein SF066_11200 [Thermoanaerobaculia bacterium]|nr:hypothetical protein [Thermoanaerobaculia bacterium]
MPTDVTDPWYWATWQGATDATLLAGARLTLSQKLDWLEELGRIARSLQGDRDHREPSCSPVPPKP